MKTLSAKDAWPEYRKFFTDWLADDPTILPKDLPFRQDPQAFKEFWAKVLEDPAMTQIWMDRFKLGYTAWKQVELQKIVLSLS